MSKYNCSKVLPILYGMGANLFSYMITVIATPFMCMEKLMVVTLYDRRGEVTMSITGEYITYEDIDAILELHLLDTYKPMNLLDTGFENRIRQLDDTLIALCTG